MMGTKQNKIRLTLPEELDALWALIEEARKSIAQLGIDQWQKGSPTRAYFEEDIAAKRSYVAVDTQGNIQGTMALFKEGEPIYDRIEKGAWRTNDAYLAIHRVAVAISARGSGVSGALMDFAAKEARKEGLKSLRIDTHEGNRPMRAMLEREGFVYCGIVKLKTGEKRVAYEKVLNKNS